MNIAIFGLTVVNFLLDGLIVLVKNLTKALSIVLLFIVPIFELLMWYYVSIIITTLFNRMGAVFSVLEVFLFLVAFKYLMRFPRAK